MFKTLTLENVITAWVPEPAMPVSSHRDYMPLCSKHSFRFCSAKSALMMQNGRHDAKN